MQTIVKTIVILALIFPQPALASVVESPNRCSGIEVKSVMRPVASLEGGREGVFGADALRAAVERSNLEPQAGQSPSGPSKGLIIGGIATVAAIAVVYTLLRVRYCNEQVC